MLNLIILFFVTSAIYSSVGFGGGSTYLALLLLWGIPYTIFPVIALSCNIIVVTGNCINYSRAGNLDLKFLAPYLVGSIPMAFIGGALSIEKELFEILLFIILLLAGLFLLINFKTYNDNEESLRKIPLPLSILIGGVLRFCLWRCRNWWRNIFKSNFIFITCCKNKSYYYYSISFYFDQFFIRNYWAVNKKSSYRRNNKLLASANSCIDWRTNWKFFKYKNFTNKNSCINYFSFSFVCCFKNVF